MGDDGAGGGDNNNEKEEKNNFGSSYVFPIPLSALLRFFIY